MKLDKSLNDIISNWYKFISILKEKLEELKNDIKDINDIIDKQEKINTILKNANIDTLLANKVIFINIDNSLEDSFKVLEFLTHKNNLDNAITPIVIEGIRNSKRIEDYLKNYEKLLDRSIEIEEEIDSIESLFNEDIIDVDNLTILCNKYHINPNEILLYPIINTLDRMTLKRNPKIKERVTSIKEEPIVNEDIDVEKEFTLKKKYFENLVNEITPYIIRHYHFIEEATPYQRKTINEYYHITSLYPFTANSSYDQILVCLIYLLNLKKDIESIDILSKDNLDKLNIYIDNYKYYLDTLKDLDTKLSIQESDVKKVNDIKVFFLCDKSGQVFIKDEVLKEYGKSIMTILNKEEQDEYITSKKCGNIMQIDVKEEIKKKLNKAILCVRDNHKAKKIAISYVYLSGKNGIMIITAEPINKNGTKLISASTAKIVEDNLSLILDKINRLEKNVPEEILLQAAVRNIIENKIDNLSEDNNERIR